MHFIAIYFPVLIDYAFSTSEKVPSPFLLINLYSVTCKIVFSLINFSAYCASCLYSHYILIMNDILIINSKNI
jgi:hypothetical protein